MAPQAAWEAYTGQPWPAQAGRGWLERLHPDDREAVETAWKQALGERGLFHASGRMWHAPSQSYRYFEARAVPVLEAQRGVREWVGAIADVHERKMAEETLRLSRDQLAAILGGVAEGVTVQDVTGRLIFANDVAAHVLGYPSAEALVAAPLQEIMSQFELLDEQGEEFPIARLPGRIALQGQPAPAALIRFRIRATGEEHWADVKARPIFDAQGRVQLAVNLFHDVTALKRSEETQRLLAEAGRILTNSLDERAMLQSLARQVIPFLADYCLIYLLRPPDDLRAVAYAHINPLKEGLLNDLALAYQPSNENPYSRVGQVLATGESRLFARLDDAAQALLPHGAQAAMRELNPQSAMIVPLHHRGRMMGLGVFVRAESRRMYTPDDLALAEELARRAALALDNARLYAETQQLNAELEQRVGERTEELEVALEELRTTNDELSREVAERRQAELKFRGLFESAPDAIVVVDARGRILLANGQTEALFGYTQAELLGQSVELLMPERFRDRHVLHRATFAAQPRLRQMGANLELMGRRKDGTEFAVEISLSPSQSPEGLLVFAAIRDVSERKRAEEYLRMSERRLSEAQQIAQLGSWH